MQNFTVYHAKFLFPNFFQRKNCSNTTKILTSYGRATFDWILCVSSKKSRYNLFPQCLLITLIKLIHMSSIYLAALQTVAVTRRPFKIWRAEIITNRPPTTPSVGSSSHWQCAVLTNVNKKRRKLERAPHNRAGPFKSWERRTILTRLRGRQVPKKFQNQCRSNFS